MKHAVRNVSLILIVVALLVAAVSCQPTGYRLHIGVNPPGAGTVSGPASGEAHSHGTSLTLTAVPAPGYEFVSWSGDASGTDATVAIAMTSEKEVVANFAAARYTLSVTVSPTAGGSVSPTGGTFDSGSVVTLTATPAPGYQFASWSGDASGTSQTVELTMTSSKTVIANFTSTKFSLSVSVSPAGSGTVNPGGGTYESNAFITLTATPAPGYLFASWSGDAFGTTPMVPMTMNSNKNVVAKFTPIRYDLTVGVSPTEGGSVSPTSGAFDAGSSVTLNATAAPCYEFASWSGDAAGASPRAVVPMNSDMDVVANFKRLTQHIERTMPPGAQVGSYATYTKELQAGEQVEGAVRLTGAPELTDWSFEFSFQIIAPDGHSVKSLSGNWLNDNYRDFSFVASNTGTYKMQVVHYSNYSLNLALDVRCPGWEYAGG